MADTAGSQTLSPAQTYSRKVFSLIAICFLFSGVTGLIYEVVWARMLGLVFGATTLAIGAVLAAFMGGLALGSAVAARFASRIVRPVRAYAVIEIAIGIYALAVPRLFRWIDLVYAEVWQHLHPGFYGFAFARFALAALVLIIPTALMGATLPLLAAAVTHSSRSASNAVARLYTCNLAGALAGAIAAGFYLLPSFGVRATIWIVAAINLAVGVAAFLIDAKVPESRSDEVEDIPASESTLQRAHSQSASDKRFWLFCAFISGFVTISMQVVWSRVLAMIIGSSTYAFSIVLALFLTGLALGAYLVSLRKNQTVSSLRRKVLLIEVLTGASLFASIRVTNATPAFLVNAGFRVGVNSWS
ncbi:MAG TPA: fused MFS/spermidine synthase, partial [Pyrinomonadaceae bacterium]|nr:fused MFS/spermidine synthase [Pyrinomonadaceae bacterium]